MMASQSGVTNKTVIITGGNTGLGYECARTIAAAHEGWHVIIASRSQEKAQEAVQRLIKEMGYAQIEVMPLDLASLDSVRSFVQAFTERELPPVQAIVCNAGIQIVSGTTYTKDGFETTFGVNHLGHFLLVNLLLRHLVAPSRVIFVSSDTHDPAKRTGMPAPRYRRPEALAWPEKYPDPAEQADGPGLIGRRRYTTSKLCNIFCTYELARRLQGGGDSTEQQSPTVNAFNPGGMPGTSLSRDWPPLARFIFNKIMPPLVPLIRLAGLDINTVSTSGKHLARLVLDPQLTNVTGKYFSGLNEIPSSQESYDSDKARELWEGSAELVKLASDETLLSVHRTVS
jgi:light-dependent protochlorophyllide reductase